MKPVISISAIFPSLRGFSDTLSAVSLPTVLLQPYRRRPRCPRPNARPSIVFMNFKLVKKKRFHVCTRLSSSVRPNRSLFRTLENWPRQISVRSRYLPWPAFRQNCRPKETLRFSNWYHRMKGSPLFNTLSWLLKLFLSNRRLRVKFSAPRLRHEYKSCCSSD